MRLWLDTHQSWIKQQLIWLFASAAFLLFIYPKTGLDQRFIAPYFNAANHQFNLKHTWLLETILHNDLKYCLMIVALGTLICSFIGKFHQPLKAYQLQLFWVFMLMVISTTVIALLKQASMHGCPNDLTQYGGKLPYLQLFETLPIGTAMGKCFPGGHASGGFALMAYYFAFREVHPKLARTMLIISLSLGFVMSWAQMMRGEHFLSHNLWSAWIVWAICVACQPLLFTFTTRRKASTCRD